MGFAGSTYTWMRGKDSNTFKGARLDRAVGTVDWINLFPGARVQHLPFTNSNHAPLLVRLDNTSVKKTPGFKFQAAWITHPDFSNKIKEFWNDT